MGHDVALFSEGTNQPTNQPTNQSASQVAYLLNLLGTAQLNIKLTELNSRECLHNDLDHSPIKFIAQGK